MDKSKLKKLFGFIKWASLIVAFLLFFGSLLSGANCPKTNNYWCMQEAEAGSAGLLIMTGYAFGMFILFAVLRWLIKEEKTTEK